MPKKKTGKESSKKPGLVKPKECPDCGSINIYFNEKRQQTFCRDCGLVFEELTPEKNKKYKEIHEL